MAAAGAGPRKTISSRCSVSMTACRWMLALNICGGQKRIDPVLQVTHTAEHKAIVLVECSNGKSTVVGCISLCQFCF